VTVEFGLMIEPQLGMTYDRILDLATFAEQRGLAAFSRSDHYFFPRAESPHATDALTTLAGLARETDRLDLVVLVSPITFRHPGVIAKAAATIDEMSGGRLVLGIGTGWMEEEHRMFGFPFYDQAERFARLEEALGYLAHAFGRLPGPFGGTYYSLETDDIRPRPTRLRLLVGGSGERRTPRLAGTYADEFNLTARGVEEIRIRVANARTAAEKAGRDPSALKISVMTPVIGGSDAAAYEDVLARIADADPRGREPEALAAVYRERGLPIGTADEVQAAIAVLGDAGVDRVYVQHLGPFDHDLLDEVFAAVGATA